MSRSASGESVKKDVFAMMRDLKGLFSKEEEPLDEATLYLFILTLARIDKAVDMLT